MATKEGTISSLPVVKPCIVQRKPFNKYKVERDPFTNLADPELSHFDIKLDKPKSDHFYYGVRVVTGDQGDAGMLGYAYVILIGDKGKTNEVILDGYFTSGIDSGTYEDFVLECDKDLGEIQLVTVGNSGSCYLPESWATWYVDYTFVKRYAGDKESVFTCYHWIALGDFFTNSARCGTLQQLASNPILVEARRTQIENRQKSYQWKKYPEDGLPSSIDTDNEALPLDERFDKCKNENFLGNLFKGLFFGAESAVIGVARDILNKLFGNKVGDVNDLANLHQFFEVASLLQGNQEKTDTADRYDKSAGPIVPYELARWTSDADFGRLILNGVNCVIIKLCIVLPQYFPVTQDMVYHSLGRSGDLKIEMKNGYVYIADLSEIMDELPCWKDNYCAAPICLLYVNSNMELIPIAIQLKRKPAADNPIFLPTDCRTDWILAKMYFSNASAQMHQLSTHYIGCHAVMEAYGVATMRALPDAHPVYKLLRPSFHYTMAINTRARKDLINNGGIMDFLMSIGGDDDKSGKNEVFKRTNETYNVHWSNIKRSIAQRDVGNPDKLPNYFYRDDGCRIWDAIERYARSIIDLFYLKDKDVANDEELQNWTSEVHNNAFPAFRNNPTGRGFPSKITNKNDLVEYCTLIMFTSSVQHSAVNFGQFQVYGYVPNSPLNLRQPCPSEKNVPKDIYSILPGGLSTILSVAVTFSLSQYSPNEIFLGGYPVNWFTEDKEKACIEAYKKSLVDLHDEIVERNKKLELPYVFLQPNRCPVSITI